MEKKINVLKNYQSQFRFYYNWMYKYPELWTHNSLLFPVAMHKITLLLFLVDNSCLTLCSPIDCSKVRLCCPPLHPGVCSNLCSLSQLCFVTISSSVVPFFCLQSFPASGSFPISQFFTSHSQSIGASASSTILPMNIQDWFCFGWMSLISLQSKALLVFSSTTIQKHQFFDTQPCLWSNSHIHK